MSITRRITVAIAAIAMTSSAWAQQWPDRPIRWIVPYPAGGGVDMVARIYAAKLSELFEQQVMVDNRSGAAGAIGANTVAKSAPDGYTFLLASPAEVLVSPIAGYDLPYDPKTDLVPVALAGETPLGIVAHPSVDGNGLEDFVSRAKSGETRLFYASPGSGSTMHFAGEAFKGATGVQMQHVPYKGAAPAVNDALGNQVSLIIAGLPPLVPHVKTGRLKALAVTSAQRSPSLPDVPAVAELPGLEDFRFTNWMGLFAPAGTPQAIVDRMGQTIEALSKDASIREKLEAAGVEAVGIHGAEFQNFLASEQSRYEAVAERSDIQVEQ